MTLHQVTAIEIPLLNPVEVDVVKISNLGPVRPTLPIEATLH